MSHGTIRRVTRRQVGMGALGLAGGLGITGVGAQMATPEGDAPGTTESPVASPVAAGKKHLFVADANAEAIYVYSVPGFDLTSTIEDITFGIHGGAFQMPDGRLLFADVKHERIVALSVDSAGGATITQDVPATLDGNVAWIAASPTFSHVAFGSLMGNHGHGGGDGHDHEAQPQWLNIVDTTTFENLEIEFEMAEPEEIHAWMAGDPLQVHVAVGGRVDSYTFAQLVTGDLTPLTSVDVELGSHGGATDATRSQILYVGDVGTGFDVMDTSSGEATFVTNIPWDLDGETGGRNARPRVTTDGNYIFGVMTPGLEDTSVWAETIVSNHIVNLADLTARRVPTDVGSFGYRWQLSDRYAMWAAIGADDSNAYLLDADATSATFGEPVKTIGIATPSNAIVAGEAWDNDQEVYIMTTMTWDSAYGFATISGDGIIQVLDLAAGTVLTDITVPSPLTGGGYTTVIEPGLVPVDLWGR